ncbi:MAG: hypothetical protein LC118_00615 [Dehalococcoidia bacterium]|nr:hypothetical protein [Dehalococcoidia bacterium]
MDDPGIVDGKPDWICPYCQTPLLDGDERMACPKCDSVYHRECWIENEGCAVFGCGGQAGAPDSPAESSRMVVAVDGEAAPAADPEPDPDRRRRQIQLGSLVAGVVLLAGVVVAIALTGQDEPEPAPPAKKPPKKTANQVKAEKRAAARRKQAIRLARTRDQLGFRWTEDPGGQWGAVLPRGRGWSGPKDRSDPEGPETRITTLSGPGRDFVGVVTTPDSDPVEDEASYTINEKRLPNSRVRSRNMRVADLIRFRNGPDDCAGIYCAKLIMSDGSGGGMTVVVGSRSATRAGMIAREFARNAEAGK